MKQLLTTTAAVLLAGCGGSTPFTEKINNPWLWIAILPILYAVLPVVLVVVIIIAGHFLLKFLFRKNKDEKIEELKKQRQEK